MDWSVRSSVRSFVRSSVLFVFVCVFVRLFSIWLVAWWLLGVIIKMNRSLVHPLVACLVGVLALFTVSLRSAKHNPVASGEYSLPGF